MSRDLLLVMVGYCTAIVDLQAASDEEGEKSERVFILQLLGSASSTNKEEVLLNDLFFVSAFLDLISFSDSVFVRFKSLLLKLVHKGSC